MRIFYVFSWMKAYVIVFIKHGATNEIAVAISYKFDNI